MWAKSHCSKITQKCLNGISGQNDPKRPKVTQNDPNYKIDFGAKIHTNDTFCPKNQLWFPKKIADFFGWKIREIVMVLDFVAVDNFDFTRKIVKKIGLENFFKIEFLDKNLIYE